MSRVVLLAALLVMAGTASAAGGGPPGPHIAAVAPNPVAADDRGEYLVISVPAPTDLTGWAVSDGESTAAFPNRTVSGTFVASTEPSAVYDPADRRIVELRGRLALANAGEAVALTDGSTVVDEVRYPRAPEGERYVRTGGEWEWRPIGITDRAAIRVGSARAHAFVLPDAPGPPAAVIDNASRRVLLAAYTFTSARIAGALCAARERGVRVRVLTEGDPVGGMTSREARTLDRLVACGVRVDVLGGDHDRFAFHHAKYAIADDRAIVMTENWKPSGTGGRSSRGWGVVVTSPRLAAALGELFRDDAAGRDAVPWQRFRAGRSFATPKPQPTARYPTRFAPARVAVDRVDVIAAPDNAERETVDLLDGANESISVEQVSIGSIDHPFVRALLRAAERGVRVRVLLSGAWYVERGNRRLAERLNERARRSGLSLSVRVAEPRSRFGKIHAKGVVVDRRRVVVGSANWNNASLRQNREVGLVLYGPAVGEYYARVFAADWRGGVWRLPVGLIGVVIGVILASGWFGNRSVRFESGDLHPDDPQW